MPVTGDTYPFTKKNVDLAPTTWGVYELILNGATIYYGRAAGKDVTIRSRLQDHFGEPSGSCKRSATDYRRESIADSEKAKAREEQLLDEYERKHGKLPRCNLISA